MLEKGRVQSRHLDHGRHEGEEEEEAHQHSNADGGNGGDEPGEAAPDAESRAASGPSTDSDIEIEKRLRFGKNQLNIADAFYKEQGEPNQILKYAKEALATFNELQKVRQDDPELSALQKKADKIVIMCTYSPSQLDELLQGSKDLFAMALTEAEQDHVLQVRWHLEKCLEGLRPLLIVWGVTPETREIVENVGIILDRLDRAGGFGRRADEEAQIFSYLDRLSLIKDMPLMDTLNEDTLVELAEMRRYFQGIKRDTGIGGIEKVFEDMDSELYNIYAEKIRIAMDAVQGINLMERMVDFDKIDAILQRIEELNIEDSRREFVLRHARDVKARYMEKMRHLDRVKYLLEKRTGILKGAVDDLPRTERLECLLHEIYDEGERPGYEIINREMIERIADILEVEGSRVIAEAERVKEAGGEELEEEGGKDEVGETDGELKEEGIREVVQGDEEGTPDSTSEKGPVTEEVLEVFPEAESDGEEDAKDSQRAGAEESPGKRVEDSPDEGTDGEPDESREGARADEGGDEDAASSPEDDGAVSSGEEVENGVDRLLRIYRLLPEGEVRDEVNRLLDGITADLIFDTTHYTPTEVSLGDDILEIIEDLKWQIEALQVQKAYFPYGSKETADGGARERPRRIVKRVFKRVVKRPRGEPKKEAPGEGKGDDPERRSDG